MIEPNLTIKTHRLKIHVLSAKHAFQVGLSHSSPPLYAIFFLCQAEAAVFECRFCEARFQSVVDLLAHAKDDHSEAGYMSIHKAVRLLPVPLSSIFGSPINLSDWILLKGS